MSDQNQSTEQQEATFNRQDVTYFKDMMRKKLLLICGYNRRIQRNLKKSLLIPMGINKLILHLFLFEEFKFSPQSPCFDVDEDQLSVTLKKHKYGAIQFGPFFTSSDKIKYSVTFLMEDIKIQNISIGFIAPGFDAWDFMTKQYSMTDETHNPIDIVLELCRQYPVIEPMFRAVNYYELLTTDKSEAIQFVSFFIKNMQLQAHVKLIQKQLNSQKPFYKLLETGAKLTIQINTFKMKIILLCETKEGDKYIINLPEQFESVKEFGIIIYGGFLESKIRVIDQKFSFHDT